MAKDYKSSHIKNFDLRQCQAASERCFEARGDLAFVSMDGHLISAADISLSVKDGSLRENYHCASFSYNVVRQTMVCERTAGEKAVMIDAQFAIRKI